MARDFDRQVAELQVRAAILNRFTQLGTPVTVRVGSLRLGSGVVRPLIALLNKASQRHAHPPWSANLQPQIFATGLYVAAQGSDRW
jgi:hypothetical protein